MHENIPAPYDEGGLLPPGFTMKVNESGRPVVVLGAEVAEALAATDVRVDGRPLPKPITVSDVDELRAQVTAMRNRVHALFNDSRLTHTQSAVIAATVDSFNALLSQTYVLKLVTS